MRMKLCGIFAAVCSRDDGRLGRYRLAHKTNRKKSRRCTVYIGFWNIPRAQWADMEKNIAVDQKILDKALADEPSWVAATT